MILTEDLSIWLGRPWKQFQTYLDDKKIAYQFFEIPIDERSQFVVDQNQLYVLKLQWNENILMVSGAGKMLGRKEA